MFETAGVRFIRSFFSAVSLAVLLGACANTSPPEPGGPKSWVVESVASKSTAELYADLIKPGVFERSSSKVIDGYTVESGNLIMPDRSVGSLVTVRSGDGSLTAVIEEAGKSGLLAINNKGESRFTPFPVRDYSLPDTVVGKAEPVKQSKSAGPYVIDMLIGYSRSAVAAVGGDAHANALAQVESVNLALRNSLVTNVSMRLVGVQIVETNYPITQETLSKLPEIFATGMNNADPDMVFGIFSDSGGGWAYIPGRTGIGDAYSPVFRHEVGHNVGGNHCHPDGGAPVPYGYGYKNGETFTVQCGNGSPYYSTPAIRDAHGLPIGDAATADMARVWRENAERLSSYANFIPKPPTGFRVSSTSYSTIDFAWNQSPRAVKYEIWGRDNLLLPPKKYGESTTLSGKATNVPNGLRPYHVIAVYSDGTKSPNSNIVNAKPYEALK